MKCISLVRLLARILLRSLSGSLTADNGKLPPWKGDYHHDLNTQLSYWPAYMGNHLQEEMGYLNTLWNQREVYKKYTKQYFECEGMNIPVYVH